MPELPEVDFARSQLEGWLIHKDIEAIWAHPSARMGDVVALGHVAGRVESVERRGKYFAIHVRGADSVEGHLGMTGHLSVSPSEKESAWVRAKIHVREAPTVHLVDPRRFGGLRVVRRTDVFQSVGRDWFDAPPTVAELHTAWASKKVPVKLALMDQKQWSGLGNIYAAEALFRARLSPLRPANDLGGVELSLLIDAVRSALVHGAETLKAAQGKYINQGAVNPFLVYGRAGERCLACASPIAQMTQGGRSTFYCPDCQRTSHS